jgi:alpha-ketoglutarate-dependent taurine dioxygenase
MSTLFRTERADGATSESMLAEKVLAHARTLGRAVPGRTGKLVERLVPTASGDARSRSLSARFGMGAFPFHTDTAHWPMPCRYVVLACLAASSDSPQTMLANVDEAKCETDVRGALCTEPFLVQNGKRSFYATIRNARPSLLRVDSACMHATRPAGATQLEGLSSGSLLSACTGVTWEPGLMIAIDNWTTLHSRGAVRAIRDCRVLLRAYVM